ncbi:MAG: hypothetical protein ACO3F0_06995, partial [Ilumatobacteraceae bacterium]
MTDASSQLLAEVEIFHSRTQSPTRRLSLGNLVLPVDPAPGLGGLLLGGIIAAHLHEVDEELVPDVHRLVLQVDRGDRVVQPRLLHRYQIDRQGLSRSRHRLVGDGEQLSYEFESNGSALQQVLGAIYSLERLDVLVRHVLTPVLHKAMRWRGPIDTTFLSYLAGTATSSITAMTDPRAWALELLGFPAGTVSPTKRDVQRRYRESLREAHPDHGGRVDDAGQRIEQLGEARRV